MEKTNSGLKGLLVLLVFAFVCFLAYYYVSYKRTAKPVDSITDELKADVTSTIDKYLVNIFMAKYCGQLDYEDRYYFNDMRDYDKDNLEYYRIKEYSSLDEIKSEFSSMFSDIVSDKLFDYIWEALILENDGKLYCGSIPRGSLAYKSGNVTVTDVTRDSDVLTVNGYYKTLETEMNASDTFNFKVSMVKSGNLWVIDSYKEIDN